MPEPCFHSRSALKTQDWHQELALDCGNGHAHASRMKTNERQFSVNRAASKSPINKKVMLQIQHTMRRLIRLVCHIPRFTSREIPCLKQITVPRCFVSVLAGVSVLCGGCASLPQTPPVSPDAPVAQLEFSAHKTYKVDGVSAYLDKVDGVKVWTLKGSMKGVGWRGTRGDHATVFELTPGVHTFEVTFNQGSPLTIELNARAGHNYRLRAHNYDEVTTSLYIEDVSTGEVVSGHRPEKVEAEPRRAPKKW